ncbi:MAG: plasmid mobilization relaxosome protein MobC [Flavisolibacter sp.]
MDKPIRRKKLPPGRPRKAVKKEITIGTRFSKIEHFIIKQKAVKAGLKSSEYIRQTALKGIVKARATDEEIYFVRQLVGMANNLNQLTKLANQQGLLRTVLHFKEYRNKIDGLLKDLKNGE